MTIIIIPLLFSNWVAQFPWMNWAYAKTIMTAFINGTLWCIKHLFPHLVNVMGH